MCLDITVAVCLLFWVLWEPLQ